MQPRIELAASCGIQLTAAASGSFLKLVLTLAIFVTLNLPVLQVKNMQLVILNDYEEMSEFAAKFVRRRILDFNPSKDRYFTLGLPTGSTPLGMYKRLIDYCKNGQLSFQFVKTFNMDEYAGIPKNHPASYHSFMYHNFFRHIDIHPSNVHILDGNAADLNKECEEFEKEIHSAGGIMLFVGGVGSDGHVAFNEPGSSLASRTRVKTLAQETIMANSRFFNNDISQVPTQALTVGVGTLLDAHEFMRFRFSPALLLFILLLISGSLKAHALHNAVENGVSHMWTASAFQLHPKATFVCDEDATLELKVRTVRYFKGLLQTYLRIIEEPIEK
ncbi:Glucosamine-6-phosphate isomerase 1 [Trichinella papuae]|uniref:Glucosamine-6-phosphate isomerase n=1 Tax=Trichinella papuae TaxID=268474 RepID=A0A0V1N7M2_9BILA|nr:Glucosamine-6-phosphate isomerase 1 [Trichinella papuae]